MVGLTRDYNPFGNLDLHIPTAYRDEVKRYTTTQGGLPILMDWLDGGVQTPMVSVTKNVIRFLAEKAD